MRRIKQTLAMILIAATFLIQEGCLQPQDHPPVKKSVVGFFKEVHFKGAEDGMLGNTRFYVLEIEGREYVLYLNRSGIGNLVPVPRRDSVHVK